MGNDFCVLLLVKYPEEGMVKTRLANEIGEVHAAEGIKIVPSSTTEGR